jgi:predicted nucleic acid-binding protein
MTVLVDTSIWIRFLSNRAPYAAHLEDLLDRDEVCGHDFVFGELLIGDAGGRRQLLADYTHMHQAPVVPHSDVAASLVGRVTLWTADPRLAALAKELGVVHDG